MLATAGYFKEGGGLCPLFQKWVVVGILTRVRLALLAGKSRTPVAEKACWRPILSQATRLEPQSEFPGSWVRL